MQKAYSKSVLGIFCFFFISKMISKIFAPLLGSKKMSHIFLEVFQKSEILKNAVSERKMMYGQ